MAAAPSLLVPSARLIFDSETWVPSSTRLSNASPAFQPRLLEPEKPLVHSTSTISLFDKANAFAVKAAQKFKDERLAADYPSALKPPWLPPSVPVKAKPASNLADEPKEQHAAQTGFTPKKTRARTRTRTKTRSKQAASAPAKKDEVQTDVGATPRPLRPRQADQERTPRAAHRAPSVECVEPYLAPQRALGPLAFDSCREFPASNDVGDLPLPPRSYAFGSSLPPSRAASPTLPNVSPVPPAASLDRSHSAAMAASRSHYNHHAPTTLVPTPRLSTGYPVAPAYLDRSHSSSSISSAASSYGEYGPAFQAPSPWPHPAPYMTPGYSTESHSSSRSSAASSCYGQSAPSSPALAPAPPYLYYPMRPPSELNHPGYSSSSTGSSHAHENWPSSSFASDDQMHQKFLAPTPRPQDVLYSTGVGQTQTQMQTQTPRRRIHGLRKMLEQGGHIQSWGKTKWFDAEKGWGFIVDNHADQLGCDVHVHYSGIRQASGFRCLQAGEAVEYTLVLNSSGKYQALMVRGFNGAPLIGFVDPEQNAATRRSGSSVSSSVGDDGGERSRKPKIVPVPVSQPVPGARYHSGVPWSQYA